MQDPDDITRRGFIGGVTTASALVAGSSLLEAQSTTPAGHIPCSLTINSEPYELTIDPRTTLLDLLREQLHLSGTKKGCDHGQCGACTIIVNGQRINSCLALAISYDGQKIITIEGLAHGENLHPMQAAFLEFDGFQCGFCTPGQICSAVAMLDEARRGAPSFVGHGRSAGAPMQLTEAEVRERMSGNICRCGAYPNIVSAVRSVYERG